MSKPVTDWSVPQRQGGPALLIIIFKTFFEILKATWPLLIAALVGGKRNQGIRYLIIGSLFLAFVFFKSIIEYFFFRFQIINNELIIRSGLFIKKTIKK